jgi:heterodisulfide reductase subunit A
LVYRIDKNKCIGCGLCEQYCKAKAVDYSQEEEKVQLNVGSIVLSPGFETFDPTLKPEYGYDRFPNVVTSIQFERILSASGPFAGNVLRPSDGKHPMKIAWIQCVGSRDEQVNRGYCSAVCCTYATKEAIIAKEHTKGTDCTIFYMDMRTYGKGFEEYYNMAKDQYGVNYIKCRIPHIEEKKDTKDLKIIYHDENGEYMEDEFNLVVLSVGMEPAVDFKDIADKFGIKLNNFGFCQTDYFTPLETSRPGIYVGGSFASPKDIPDAVAQASGVASKASSLISSERDSLVSIKDYPQEIDLGDEPRIGVFCCHCGINIGSIVDVPEVVEYAKTLPNVVYTDHNLYTCSQDTQDKIKDAIKENHLNRVIVASCTPRTHEPLFQNTIKEVGLNPYLFDLASTREHVSWVHKNDPEKATEKAKHMVSMAVEKVRRNKMVRRTSVECEKAALIVGGGIAGMTAALDLADQGFSAYIVEKKGQLGGNLRNIHHLLSGEDPQKELAAIIKKVKDNRRIQVFTEADLQNLSGYIGNFTATVNLGSESNEFKVGTIIVAAGANEFKPNGHYLYGKDPRIVTQLEFDKKLHDEGFSKKNVVMIQCVGSRDDDREYCSRVCCTEAIKNALKVKELNPDANVYILYRDIRTYGFREKYYKEAREKGISFIRYTKDKKPQVEKEGEKLKVTVYNPNLRREIVISPDVIALSAATIPYEENGTLGQVLKVPLTGQNFSILQNF